MNGSVLVVKTHEWGANARKAFAKAILLVRAPGPAIQAEFNRQSGGHVGFASPERYRRTKGKCNRTTPTVVTRHQTVFPFRLATVRARQASSVETDQFGLAAQFYRAHPHNLLRTADAKCGEHSAYRAGIPRVSHHERTVRMRPGTKRRHLPTEETGT